eukprot:215994-Chlamydomonas_euryale.AAC.1
MPPPVHHRDCQQSSSPPPSTPTHRPPPVHHRNRQQPGPDRAHAASAALPWRVARGAVLPRVQQGPGAGHPGRDAGAAAVARV